MWQKMALNWKFLKIFCAGAMPGSGKYLCQIVTMDKSHQKWHGILVKPGSIGLHKCNYQK